MSVAGKPMDIWDSLARDATAESLPVPDAHKAVLDERMKSDDCDPDADRPWPDVIDDILRRPR